MSDKKETYTLEFEASEQDLTEFVVTVGSSLEREIKTAVQNLLNPPPKSEVRIRKKEDWHGNPFNR